VTIDDIQTIRLYERKALARLLEWMDSDEILVITGSRQVGKTSLLFLLIQHLLENSVSKDHIFYFDLEDFEILDLCNQGVKQFVDYLHALGADFNTRVYVFIDEIQYLDNPTNFLKLLHDHHKNIKTVCSGSSSLDNKRKFKDSLVGRKLAFELYPLSFEEYALFRNKPYLQQNIQQYSLRRFLEGEKPEKPLPIVLSELQSLFDEYVMFGGLPAIALINEHNKKNILLNEIYQTYIRKDINQMFTIENISAFNRLTSLLGFQIGQMVNIQELSTAVSSARQTVQNYLFILESTFILRLLYPFYTNKRKEIVKMPKVYFHDIGLRNQLIKSVQPLHQRTDAGAIVENFSFSQIVAGQKVQEAVKFWRSQNGNEVDFIIESNNIVPVEVKYRSFIQPQIPNGIRFFVQKYASKNAFVVTKDYYACVRDKDCNVFFVPASLFSM
jgi:predicted AAA+ superfamily ATPase